ncbi:MAG: hypothetical protein K6G88_05690 [Lachnospiraceae bacterium]|nr:hypothetical protein [Lachnospiraceae bacterium]
MENRNKNMLDYIHDNIEILKKYCLENNLSVDKILKSPRCYNKNELYVQYRNTEKKANNLKCDVPAKILLVIRKTPDGMSFEPAKDIIDYLGNN